MKTISKSKKPVLVIGDLMLDVHHFGETGGVSAEASIPVGIESASVFSWGGAGLVVRNILALGSPVYFASVLGEDDYSKKANQFEHARLRKIFIMEKERQVVVKERFMIGGEKILRWNRGSSKSISKKTVLALTRQIEAVMGVCRAVIIADYRQGLMSEAFAHKIGALASKSGVPVYVDSQAVRLPPNYHWYGSADLLCLNESEARAVSPRFKKEDTARSIEELRSDFGVKNIVVKLGQEGSASSIGGIFIRTHAHKVVEVDPVGAGDAFLGALATRSYPPLPEDLVFANLWAALSVKKVGTEPPTLADLRRELKK